MSRAGQGQFFISQAQTYAPSIGGVDPFISTGFEGTPLGNNPMLGMIGGQMLGNLMGKAGFAPMGLGHDRNVWDTMQAQRFWRLQQDLQRNAAELDRSSWINTMRGVAHMAGTPWGSEQMQAARGLSSAMVNASPFLNMIAPEIMDEMAGYRGSGAVMAGKMMMAGRYRYDQSTGLLGQDPKMVGATAKHMFEDMFVRGEMRETAGFSAGQIGGIYEQLSMRGMIAGSQQTTDDQIRTAFKQSAGNLNKLFGTTKFKGDENISPERLEELRQNPQMAEGLRAVDATKVNASLKTYLKAIAAVRDVFGDLGHPNAPMAELVNALEAMTNGSMGQINPARLDTMVRMTHQLAQNTGVGLDQALMMQQHAASRAAQMGLEPSIAIGANQGAMAFGGAYRALGLGNYTAWGKMNAEQMQQLDQHMRVNAAGSRLVNRFALALRLGDQYKFDKTSDFGALIEGLNQAQSTGQTEFTLANGKTMKFADVTESTFMQMSGGATVGGNRVLNQADVGTMLNQRFANSAFIGPGGLDAIGRQAQHESGIKFMQQQLQGFLASRLGRRDILGAEQTQLASSVSQAAARQIMDDLTPEEYADDRMRNIRITEILRKEMGRTSRGRQLGDEFYAGAASSFIGQTDENIRYDPNLSYMGSTQQLFIMGHQPLHARTNRMLQMEKFTADIRNTLTPLNRGGMLTRVSGYLQRLGEDGGKNDDKLWGLVSEVMGGVDQKEIQRLLGGNLRSLAAAEKEGKRLQEQLANATTPGQFTALAKQREDYLANLRIQTADTQSKALVMGVTTDEERLTPEDTNKAIGYIEAVESTQKLADAATVDENGKPLTPAERNKSLDKFFATTEGQQYSYDTRKRGSWTDAVAMKTIGNDLDIRQFGLAGVKQARIVRDSEQKLRELAFEYAGNRPDALMSGQLDPSLSKEQYDNIRKQTADALGQSTAATKEIRQMQDIKQNGAPIEQRLWDKLIDPVKKVVGDIPGPVVSAISPDLERARQSFLREPGMTALWGKDLEAVRKELGGNLTLRQVQIAHAMSMSIADMHDVQAYQDLLDRRSKGEISPALEEKIEEARKAVQAVAGNVGRSLKESFTVSDMQSALPVYHRQQELVDGDRNLNTLNADKVFEEYGVQAEFRADKKSPMADMLQGEGGDTIRSMVRGHALMVAAGRKAGDKEGKNESVVTRMYGEFMTLGRDKFISTYAAKLKSHDEAVRLADAAQLQAGSGFYVMQGEKETPGVSSYLRRVAEGGFGGAFKPQEPRFIGGDEQHMTDITQKRLTAGVQDAAAKVVEVSLKEGTTIRGDLAITSDGRATMVAKTVSASANSSPIPPPTVNAREGNAHP